MMPHQRLVLEIALELDPTTGLLVYRDVVLSLPRQQAKSTTLAVAMTLRCLSGPDQHVVYSSTTGQAAKDWLFDVYLKRLKESRFRDLFTVRGSTGHEQIQWSNGSTIGLAANTTKSGMGTTNNMVVLDEAYALDAKMEQNLRPTLITQPGSQLWICSTAGTPADSAYWLAKETKGREQVEANVRTGACYFNWSAPDDAPPGDAATWRACMPALGYSIQESDVAADFASFDVGEFSRAHLNRWVSAMHVAVVSANRWNALQDDRSEIDGPIVFAIDVARDRGHASIAAAGRRQDGQSWHIEVLESESGVSWLVPRLRQLVTRHDPVGVYVDAMSASLVPEIEASGVVVTPMNAATHAAAFAHFMETVADGSLHHRRDDYLAESLVAASTRPLGDGGKAWSRRGSNVNIDGLVACTLALWGAQIRQAPPTVYGPSDFSHLAVRASLARHERELVELEAQLAALDAFDAEEALLQ